MKPVTLEDELRRNSDLKKEELSILKEWYSKQPHLPPITDELLALFLHSCYYRIEPAKTTIDNYFTTRTHVPEFFTNRDPFKTDVKRGQQVVRFIVLPDETPDGNRILCTSFGLPDPTEFNFNEVVKSLLMTADLDHYYHGSSNGFIICCDMKNTALGHVTRINLLSLKKILYYFQEAMPVRLKGIHFINIVPFMDKIIGMMRPFLKGELMESIVLHSDMTTLYEVVPQKMLPKEYGGSAPSVEEIHDGFIKLRRENKKWFDEEAKLRVVESKRPGKSKSAAEVFGIEGSFKKLDLD